MSEKREHAPLVDETEQRPKYIRAGATVFEHNGVKYGYKKSGDDLYVDGPPDDEKYDACYKVSPDGVVNGDEGAVPESEQPDWVGVAVDEVRKGGDW